MNKKERILMIIPLSIFVLMAVFGRFQTEERQSPLDEIYEEEVKEEESVDIPEETSPQPVSRTEAAKDMEAVPGSPQDIVVVYTNGEEREAGKPVIHWEKSYLQLKDIPQAERVNEQIREEIDATLKELLEIAHNYKGKKQEDIYVDALGYKVLYYSNNYLAFAIQAAYSYGEHSEEAAKTKKWVLTYDLNSGNRVTWEDCTDMDYTDKNLKDLAKEAGNYHDITGYFSDLYTTTLEYYSDAGLAKDDFVLPLEEYIPYYFNEEGLMFFYDNYWLTHWEFMTGSPAYWVVEEHVEDYSTLGKVAYERLTPSKRSKEAGVLGEAAEWTVLLDRILDAEKENAQIQIVGAEYSDSYPTLYWERNYIQFHNDDWAESINQQLRQEINRGLEEGIEYGRQYGLEPHEDLDTDNNEYINISVGSNRKEDIFYISDRYLVIRVESSFRPEKRNYYKLSMKNDILVFDLNTGKTVDWEDLIEADYTEENLLKLVRSGYDQLIQEDPVLFSEKSLDEFYRSNKEKAVNWYEGTVGSDYGEIPLGSYIPYYFTEEGIVFPIEELIIGDYDTITEVGFSTKVHRIIIPYNEISKILR